MGRHGRKRRTQASEATNQTRRDAQLQAHKKYNRTKLFILIFGIVALLAIIGTVVAVIAVNIVRGETVDYMNDDLSKYVYISEEDYRNFTVTAKLDPVDDLAIDNSIIQLLYNYRSLDQQSDSLYYIDMPKDEGGNYVRPLGVGDTVFIRYRGYTLDGEGNKIDFDGGSNFSDSEATEVGIGQGAMIAGFELGLIGKYPGEYSRFSKLTDRPVKRGDLIKLTYTVAHPDGTTEENVTKIINTDPAFCDAVYGNGFSDFLVGKSVGALTESAGFFLGGSTVKTVYMNMEISAIYEPGDNPLTVSARFPVGYGEQTLAGKTVYFDVYIDKIQLYTVPEVNEEFITEHMGFTLEDFGKYDGEGIDAKFRSYIEEAIKALQQSEVDTLIEEAMWEHYLDKVQVKRLPEGEVLVYYDDYIKDITDRYTEGEDTYGNIDSYALTLLELEAGDDWRAYVRSVAERSVTEKIVFYYIIRQENFLPSDVEYERLYEQTVREHLEALLEQFGCEPGNYKTEAEYKAAVKEYEKMMHNSIYSEDYFRENVIFVYAMEKLRDFANVVYE